MAVSNLLSYHSYQQALYYYSCPNEVGNYRGFGRVCVCVCVSICLSPGFIRHGLTLEVDTRYLGRVGVKDEAY